VLANLIVYVFSVARGGDFFAGPSSVVVRAHSVVPSTLTHTGHRWHALVEAIFVHGSFVHLMLDMYFFALFAPSVEDACGHVRFLALYLLGGLVAIGLALLLAPNSTVPVLGCTGAVAAVLGFYLIIHPRARVISLVLIPFLATIVEVPALLLLALWFGVQLWLGLAALADPVRGDWAIAYAAQTGAFLFGALATRLLGARSASVGGARA
jgi:membrane associated rhomboid family serine protease